MWCQATLSDMNEIGWPLWVWAITAVGLPEAARHAGEHVEQCAVVVAVDLDDLEAEGGQLVGERLEVVGLGDAWRPAAAGCGRRSTHR